MRLIDCSIFLSSAVGGVVAGLSVFYGAVVLLVAMVHGSDVPGFATVVSLITFLLGLIICMLGVIGEYLWRIFDEINKRPDAVIEEFHPPEPVPQRDVA